MRLTVTIGTWTFDVSLARDAVEPVEDDQGGMDFYGSVEAVPVGAGYDMDTGTDAYVQAPVGFR